MHGQKGGRGEGGERAEEEVDGHKRGGRAEGSGRAEGVDGQKRRWTGIRGVDGQKREWTVRREWTGRRGGRAEEGCTVERQVRSKPAEHMKCNTGLEKVERSLFKFECWQLRHLVDNKNCLESSGQQ